VWRVIPVILTTWEAQIGKIVIGAHLRQKVSKTPSQQISLVHPCNPSYTGSINRRLFPNKTLSEN
jgi:hypothetical protein